MMTLKNYTEISGARHTDIMVGLGDIKAIIKRKDSKTLHGLFEMFLYALKEVICNVLCGGSNSKIINLTKKIYWSFR